METSVSSQSLTLWILEDDPQVTHIFKTLLQDYSCTFAKSLAELGKLVQSDEVRPNLLLADLMVEDGSFCDWLQVNKDKIVGLCPFIVVSGRHDIESMRQCLTMGAFDYITKPFVVSEVLVKIERALALKTKVPVLHLDAATHSVRADGGPTISLTAKQFQILTLIHEAYPEPVNKEEIERVIWGKTKVNQGNLAVHLSLLRSRLKSCLYDIVRVEPAAYRLIKLEGAGATIAEAAAEG